MRRQLTRPEQPRYYNSFGECIFCRDDNVPLTKEHAIPFALDGSIVIRGATCETCRKITKDIEEINLKGPRSNFGFVRARDLYKSRRPKERIKHVPMIVNRGAYNIKHNIPIKEAPGILILPVFGAPGILIGSDVASSLILYQLKCMNEDISAIKAKYGDSFIFSRQFNVPAFIQMLAKIAHCVGVVTYGLDGFDAYLPDLILGKRPDLSGYLVGNNPNDLSSTIIPKNKQRCLVRMMRLRSGLIASSIKLFCSYDTPTYCVVIGKVTPLGLSKLNPS